MLCRFRRYPGHVCRRRDGRVIHPSESVDCAAEARAQVDDLIALRVEVDASLPTSWLLANVAEWGGEAA